MSLLRYEIVAIVLASLSVVTVTGQTVGWGTPYFPPVNSVPKCTDPTVANSTRWYEDLVTSNQISAQVVTTRIGIPFDVLIPFFDQPLLWPLWHPLFSDVWATNYSLCAPFNGVNYTTTSPPFPADTLAPHWLDQRGYDATNQTFAFGWFFQFTSGGALLAYGRHTFTLSRFVDQSGMEATLVESFEKAAGPALDDEVMAFAWTEALQESMLDTANAFPCLERVYRRTAALDILTVAASCGANWKP
jgi:hypothetical protein